MWKKSIKSWLSSIFSPKKEKTPERHIELVTTLPKDLPRPPGMPYILEAKPPKKSFLEI